MDDILRALQRRYRGQGDQESAHLYITALERAYGSSDEEGASELDTILMNLLLDHLDGGDGVRLLTMNATNSLIRLMYGEEGASCYRRLVDQYGLEYNTLEQLLKDIGHSCEGSNAKCEVKGCLCPGRGFVQHDGGPKNTCFHHIEMLEYNGAGYFHVWGIEFD